MLAEIAAAMRDAGVSIESLIQRGVSEPASEGGVLVAIVTHEVLGARGGAGAGAAARIAERRRPADVDAGDGSGLAQANPRCGHAAAITAAGGQASPTDDAASPRRNLAMRCTPLPAKAGRERERSYGAIGRSPISPKPPSVDTLTPAMPQPTRNRLWS